DGRTGALISSLVGSQAGDQVGNGGVTALSDGNFLVCSPAWNGNAGAVTWASGTSGVSGMISATNSLVGANPNDLVGGSFIDYGNGNSNYGTNLQVLSNDNYLVLSPSWNGGMGAATWGSATTGVSGTVSAANSLVG